MLKRIFTMGLLTGLLLIFVAWTQRQQGYPQTGVTTGTDICTQLIQSCPAGCEDAAECRQAVVKEWVAKCRSNPSIAPEAQERINAACTECNKRCYWLNGTWEGKAYQSNTKTSWTLKLTAQDNSYSIEYPSLSCGGNWYLVSQDSRTARFKERITYGADKCVDNGNVLIERIDPSQVAFRYTLPDSTDVVASATLRKQQ